MSGQPVDEYEVLYRETRNPLFAWEAMARTKRGEPLPDWLWDYFVGAAYSLHALGQPPWDDVPRDQIESRHAGVLDLTEAVCEGKIEAEEAAKLTPRALGLKRGKKGNAFAELKQVRQEFADAWHVDVTRRGQKQESTRRELETRGKSRSQINRRLARARALWAAQRDAKE